MFTAFAVGGVANAVNIIDGFNGLASGTVVICLGALGFIALGAGDVALAHTCFIVAAVVTGFFVVNFPFGKLFLGDGGAYFLGFVLAWLAVMLCARNPSVSPWASLMACGYPIFETLFTIVRRVWANSHPGAPDSQHLHSLVKVAVSNRLFAGLRADLRNASVSPFSWAIAAVPAALAIRFSSDTGALLAACAASVMVYGSAYAYLIAAASAQGEPDDDVSAQIT
jgi:UDP-N-acetylmuramyl pentapeptide phosphotransferase/UDP-N-acetylglucosamine-1-phosphate transferase